MTLGPLQTSPCRPRHKGGGPLRGVRAMFSWGCLSEYPGTSPVKMPTDAQQHEARLEQLRIKAKTLYNTDPSFRERQKLPGADSVGNFVAKKVSECPFTTAEKLRRGLREATGASVSLSSVYRALHGQAHSYKRSMRCRTHSPVPTDHPFLASGIRAAPSLL